MIGAALAVIRSLARALGLLAEPSIAAAGGAVPATVQARPPAPPAVSSAVTGGRPSAPAIFRPDLPALGAWHRRFPDSIEWRLTRTGLETRRSASDPKPELARTRGEPATARRAIAWFGEEMEHAAVEFGVPFELLVATLCTEAVGAAATREAACVARREEPGYLSDEATPLRVSVGCGQTLIGTARAALRRPGLAAADLCDPLVSIRAAAAYISGQQRETGFDPPLVGAAYNAGSVRRHFGPRNPWRLVCHPIATGHHVTRFAAFFGDALAVCQADPALVGAAPSFAVAFGEAAAADR